MIRIARNLFSTKKPQDRFEQIFDLYLYPQHYEGRRTYVLFRIIRSKKHWKRISRFFILGTGLLLGLYTVPGNHGIAQEKLKTTFTQIILNTKSFILDLSVGEKERLNWGSSYLSSLFQSYLYYVEQDLPLSEYFKYYLKETKQQINLYLQDHPQLLSEHAIQMSTILFDILQRNLNFLVLDLDISNLLIQHFEIFCQQMRKFTNIIKGSQQNDSEVERSLANLTCNIAFLVISTKSYDPMQLFTPMNELATKSSIMSKILSQYFLANRQLIYQFLATDNSSLSTTLLISLRQGQPTLLKQIFSDQLISNLIRISTKWPPQQVDLLKELLRKMSDNQEIMYLVENTNVFDKEVESINALGNREIYETELKHLLQKKWRK